MLYQLVESVISKLLETYPGENVWEPKIAATNVSAIVDPQEDDTWTYNPNYTPQDRTELIVALRNLINDLPEEFQDQTVDIYHLIGDTLDKMIKDRKNMKKNKAVNKQIEEALRKRIRKILFEAPGAAYHGMDFFADDTPMTPEEEAEKKNRRKYKKTRGVTDNVRSQADVAKELGVSTSKLNQEEQIYHAKRGYLRNPEIGGRIMRTAQNDYIEYLQMSGVLDDADVADLKNNIDLVEDLDGYKNFLAIYTFDDPGFVSFATKVLKRPEHIVAAWTKRESKKLEKQFPGGWFK